LLILSKIIPSWDYLKKYDAKMVHLYFK